MSTRVYTSRRRLACSRLHFLRPERPGDAIAAWKRTQEAEKPPVFPAASRSFPETLLALFPPPPHRFSSGAPSIEPRNPRRVRRALHKLRRLFHFFRDRPHGRDEQVQFL